MHSAVRRSLEGAQLVSAQPNDALAAGTIHVTVVDRAGTPIAGAPIRIGVMAQGGTRSDVRASSASDGTATFTRLATGSGQAYRVNVTREGATTSSTPFRLEEDHGHEVRITLLPVTHDENAILQFLGMTVMELKPGRLHVQQAAELMNLSEMLYVFPSEGLFARLPPGHLAFQSSEVMTDQHIAMEEGGFRLKGSLAPGRVQLTWAFDLPLDGTTLAFEQPMPFARTYVYRVVADAAPGMSLEVDGFPPTQRLEAEGREYVGTQVEHGPTDPPLRSLRVRLEGIPGPGPFRYVAIALAVGLIGLGAYLFSRGRVGERFTAEARSARKEELLGELVTLERDRERGEVGPGYHARRRRELVDELALLLKLDERDGGAAKPRAA
jgi:hypothetical protein